MKLFVHILTLGLLLSMTTYGQQKAVSKINTIVIDAGHGGSDVGARGRYSTEAQLTLQISLRLEKMLKEALPDTKIIMTRTTDVYHNVREKANIANAAKGDLFVCVHVNAAGPIVKKEFSHYKTVTYKKGRKKLTKKVPVYKTYTFPNPVHGTSTYVFAADRIDEKASGIIGNERFESSSEVVDVPDPTSPEAIIKARLWSQKFFKNSVRLGTMIENEFVQIGRKSMGVLQRNEKGIWVLQATNMPAVLIETGFITNPQEEDYLNSDVGQNEMADAITKAVINYKKLVETPKTSGNSTGKTEIPVAPLPVAPKTTAELPRSED